MALTCHPSLGMQEREGEQDSKEQLGDVEVMPRTGSGGGGVRVLVGEATLQHTVQRIVSMNE